MSTTLVAPRPPRINALPPSPVEAALDAAYETHRRFRHGAFAEPCPTCHVPAGELCLARRSVHVARRQRYRQNQQAHTLVPLLVARSR